MTTMRQCLAALLLVLSTLLVCAQPAAPAASGAPNAVESKALPAVPLVLSSRTVMTFRGPLLGVSAQDRAKRAHARIHDQLDRSGPHAVGLQADGQLVQVQIDGATSFLVTPADLDPGREISLEQAAQEAAVALTQAVREYQESRSLQTLLRALAQALAGTALFGLMVWLLAWGRGWLSARLLAVAERHGAKLKLGGVALLRRERLANAVGRVLKLLYRLLVFVLTVEWLSYVLLSFPFTRAWGEQLNAYLLELALPLLIAALGAVPELLTALLIFYIAYLVTSALNSFFARVQQGQVRWQWLDADVALASQRIAKVLVWLFALAMAYPYLPGSNTEAFKGLSVLVGLMLSLGASSLVGQAASGLILTYGRVFRKGEYVRVVDQEGTVTEMGMFTTRIRTGLGEEITVSNASILGSITKNYSRAVKGPGFVLDTTVTIGYDTPWRQVHALLIEAARRTPGVLADPVPEVFQTALSDWYPVYRLVCQAIPEGPRPRAYLLSQLHANIQDLFSEYGVQIMSPQYVEDPQSPKLVPTEKWWSAPAVKPDGPR